MQIGAAVFLTSAFYGLGIGAVHDWRMGKAYDINFLIGLSGMALGAFMMHGLVFLGLMLMLSGFALIAGSILWHQGYMKGADIWGISLYAGSGAVISMPALLLSYMVTVPIYRFLYTQKFEELRSDEGVRALPGFLIAWIIGLLASFFYPI